MKEPRCKECFSAFGFWAPAGSNDWGCRRCGSVWYNARKHFEEGEE